MELRGLSGMAAHQTYLRVIFYLRLVRETMQTTGKDFESLIDEFKQFDAEKKKQVFTELLAISPIADRDVLRLCAVHSDKNGIRYSKNNIENLTPVECMKLCLETLIACSNAGDDLFF